MFTKQIKKTISVMLCFSLLFANAANIAAEDIDTLYRLANRSFDDGLSGWSSWQCSPIVVGDAPEGFAHSVKIENPSGDGFAIWNSSMELPSVWDYIQFEAWFKITEEQSGGFSVRASGTEDLFIFHVLPNLTPGEWVHAASDPVEFNQAGAEQITIAFEGNITGVYITDVRIAKRDVSVHAAGPGKYPSRGDRMAFAVYLPWHGNPIEYGSTGKNDGWFNWQWDEHGDITHYPSRVLPNGQRDIASVLYPIVGAYSNTDRDTLRYQLEIMKAAHIDGVFITDYGKEILQEYRACVDIIMDLAEELDMFVALQYEPKMHFSGWVPSTRNQPREVQIQGIIDDIIYILENYAPGKSYLKVDGLPVIAPFDTNLVSDNEWGFIKQQVREAGYGEFFLIADRTPGSLNTQNIDGAYNWIHGLERTYRDYDDVYDFAVRHNGSVYDWARRDFDNRLGIGHAWPGFDDWGVGGDWGAGNRRLFPFLSDDPKGSTLQAIQRSNLEAMPDWIIYATFNDWNEATVLEPSVQHGYRFLQEAQEFLEEFKGLPPGNRNAMQEITEGYLNSRAALNGPVRMTLEAGYTSAYTAGFSFAGSFEFANENTVRVNGRNVPLTVIKASGSDYITWNSETQRLDISEGLESGVYPVELQVRFGALPAGKFDFVLTVEHGSDLKADEIADDEENNRNMLWLLLIPLILGAGLTIILLIRKKQRQRNS